MRYWKPQKLSRLKERFAILENHRLSYYSIELPININDNNYDSFVRDRCNRCKEVFDIEHYYDDGAKKDFIAINLGEVQEFLKKPVKDTFGNFIFSVNELIELSIRLFTVQPRHYVLLLDAPTLFWFEHPEIKKMKVRTTRIE